MEDKFRFPCEILFPQNRLFLNELLIMQESKSTLIIFTVTYPYDAGAEQTFIGRELPYLAKYFDKVILIPKKLEGKLLQVPDNDNIETNEEFATIIKKKSLNGVVRRALLSSLFYQDIISHPEILIHITMLARLLRFVGEAELLRQWLESWIEENQINYKNTLFYSFWFDQLAMGIGLLKERFPDLNLISRAHGYDIYEERYNPPYWPCRQKALEKLDKLFLASEDARSYMMERYPKHSSLYETAHLGVQDSGFTSSASQDGVFRIVSCSSLVPLKRIDLLIRGIGRAAQMCPNQKFHWRHFGDGPARKSLQEELKLFPQNAEGYLDGYVPIEQIMNYYRENPVDVIVNVSESEGGSPVSIMEALSCGIPAIATAVGGNPEIVSGQNGILLNADPSPDDVAEALLEMLDNPEETARKRAASRTVWQEEYDAARNFDVFAKRLKAIMGVFV